MTSSSLALSPHLPTPAVTIPKQPVAWRAVLEVCARTMMISTVAVSAVVTLDVDMGVHWLLVAAVMGFLSFALVSLGDGVVSLLCRVLAFLFSRLHFRPGEQVVRAIPAAATGRILAVFLYAAGDILWPESFFQYLQLPVAGELVILFAGLTAVLLTAARLNRHSEPRRLSLIGAAIAFDLTLLAWLALPGFDGYLPTIGRQPATALLLPDPGQAGDYPVQSLSYGSGTSSRRPEYGSEANLITPSVDGRSFFPGYSGFKGRYHQWYWGFDFSQLPLNGLVWYPQGEGPFPLVLIVHGNHAMSEPSDPGYAYLAEHLASRGYIAVSVDENYLNGLMVLDGELQEIPLRAWLLLQHLQQWQNWNDTPGNPFYGRVDLAQIGLIGHSRGGEAVAHAAEMNGDDDYNFGIQGVVAIAPSDNYRPASGAALTVEHASYLLLAGGHDGDTHISYGLPQYNRVDFRHNPDGFKALAYLYQANHGQFNTVWANRDRGFFGSLLLNRAPLMAGEAQREAAKVLITTFLDAAVRGQAGYRQLFANPAAATSWLPAGILVTQYADASFITVNSNRPNTRITNIDAGNSVVTVANLTTAEVERLELRDGQTPQRNSALHLEWTAGPQPVYAIEIAAERLARWQLTAQHSLTFALANAPETPAVQDIWIELAEAGGVTARLPLSHFGPIYPALPAHLVKADWISPLKGFQMVNTTPYETVLQSYNLPLTAFQAANPAFNPAELQVIRFLFDGTTAGALYLDEIGFNSPLFMEAER